MNNFQANRDIRINRSTVNVNNHADQPYKSIEQMYPEELRQEQTLRSQLLRNAQWQRMKPLLILTAVGFVVLWIGFTFEEQLAVYGDRLNFYLTAVGTAATLLGFMGLDRKSVFEIRQEQTLHNINMRLRELER